MNSPLNSEIQLTLDDVFQTACDLPLDERQAFLDEACAGNTTMRHEVEELLSYYETNKTFLEKPAFHDVAQEMANSGSFRAAFQSQPMIGRQIGNYRIMAMLGKGGMSEVYLAHDNDLDVDVAIKFLPEVYASDPEWQARFNREGRLNSELTHENIAALRHKGEADGRPFLVFEYVPGETLDDKLDKGPLPIKEALPIFQQLAAALAHAHSRNIIHRDLKPSNIKITPDGQLKVLDFGIAKRITTDLTTLAITAAGPADQQTRDFGETRKGEVIGTVLYMSPEQTRGEMLDAGTDIWSFGCVMYEALTGRPPFKGVDTYDTLGLIRDQKHEPDWRALPTDTPKTVQRFLRQCFVRDRQRRLPSASEVQEAIEQMLSPAIKRWKRIALGATALLAVSAAVILWLWATRQPERTYLALAPFNESGERQDKVGEELEKSLRASLAGIPNLKVLPYSKSNEMKLLNATPSRLLRAWGVNRLLVGDVQHQGDKIEVHFKLYGVEAKPLSENIVTGSRSGFAQLRAELANSVARALKTDSKALAATASFNAQSSEEKYLKAVANLQGDLTPKSIEDAIRALTELAEAEPQSARVQAMLARAYTRKAQLTHEDNWMTEALKASEKAIGLDQNSSEVRVTRGKMLTYLKRFDEAIETFQNALQVRPEDAEAALGLARAYEEKKQFANAEQAYRQITVAWPGYWLGHNELGAFYYGQGRCREALEEWRRVTAIDPDNLSGNVNVGNAHICLGEYYQAEQAARLAMQNQAALAAEEAVDTWLLLGTAQFYQTNYTGAVESFRQGLKVNDNDPLLYGNLGDALRWITGEEQAAADAYTQAIEIRRNNQDDEVGKARLAELYAKRSKLPGTNAQGTASDASKALSLIRQVLPSEAAVGQAGSEISTVAIRVYALLGDFRQAISYLELASQAGHNVTDLQNDPELRNLRQDPGYQAVMRKYQTRQ